MHKFAMVAKLLCMGALVFGAVTMVGCSKKPDTQDLSKLEESRSAAEGAERKLADLKQERMKLEQDLQSKQSQLQGSEKERDSLQQKVNK